MVENEREPKNLFPVPVLGPQAWGLGEEGGDQQKVILFLRRGAGNHFGSQKNSPVAWGNAAASLSDTQVTDSL